MKRPTKHNSSKISGVNVDSDLPIVKWTDELKQKHKDIPRNVTPSAFIKRGIKQYNETGKSKGDGYDYKGAIKSGVRPEIDPESKTLHWGSINPNTGKALKGKKHPTKHKSDEVEAKRNLSSDKKERGVPFAKVEKKGRMHYPLPEGIDSDTPTRDRIAQTLVANEDKPFVKRIYNPKESISVGNKGKTGTHRMESYKSEGRSFASPQIQKDESGKLKNYGKDGWKRARRNKNAIEFDKDEDAKFFAKNYKEVSKKLREATNPATKPTKKQIISRKEK